MNQTAGDRLATGDRARRLLVAGIPADEVAKQLGVSPAAVRKSVWLSDAFPPEQRNDLRDCLDEMGPSHLEAVAAVRDSGLRTVLIRTAAAERLPVRELRLRAAAAESVGSPAPTAHPGQLVTCSGPDELSRAQFVVERYARFTDAQLRRLLAGPAGPTIRRLTVAVQSLTERLAAHADSETSSQQPVG